MQTSTLQDSAVSLKLFENSPLLFKQFSFSLKSVNIALFSECKMKVKKGKKVLIFHHFEFCTTHAPISIFVVSVHISALVAFVSVWASAFLASVNQAEA